MVPKLILGQKRLIDASMIACYITRTTHKKLNVGYVECLDLCHKVGNNIKKEK